MIGAALDGIGILCDLNIIKNVTEVCVVVDDENSTSSSTGASWTDELNAVANTTAGACLVMLLWCVRCILVYLAETDRTTRHESNRAFLCHACTYTAYVFFASALLGLVDYSIGCMMDEPEDYRFKTCCGSSKPGARSCQNWRQFDWLFYGTVLFVVVGLCEVFNAAPFEFSMRRNVINQVLWLTDSLMFLIDWFAWQEGCCGSPADDEDEDEDDDAASAILDFE